MATPPELADRFSHGLTLLARLSTRRPGSVRLHLDALFANRLPRLLMPALRVAMENGPALAEVLADHLAVGTDTDLLHRVVEAVPNRTLSLSSVGYAAASRLASLTEGLTPADEDGWLRHAAVLAFLAHHARMTGRTEQALDTLERATRWLDRMEACFPGQSRAAMANALYVHAALLADLQRMEEAHRTGARAVDLLRPLAQAHPGQFMPQLHDQLSDQAGYLLRLGRVEEALALVDEALLGRQALSAMTHALPDAEWANNYACKAEILEELGRIGDALAMSEQATAIYIRLFENGGEHGDTCLVDLLSNLIYRASLFLMLERHADALEVTLDLMFRLQGSWDRLMGMPGHPDLASIYFDVGQLLMAIDQPEFAIPIARLAVQEFSALCERDGPRHAPNLEDAHALQARAEAAMLARGVP